MKTLIKLCAMVFVTLCIVRAGDKPELNWKSFDAGFAEAKKMNKKVLVDVYTDWCGWCKRLDRDTYQNEQVAQYLNAQYVVVKLNAESGKKISYKDTTFSESGFAQAFGVNGYPTIIFFDSMGNPINSIGGYLNAEKFLPVARYIGEDFYKNMSWQDYQDKEAQKTKETGNQ